MNKSSTNAPEENAGDDALDMLLDPAPEQAEAAKPTESKEAAAPPTAKLDEPPAIAKLEAATKGLQMQSESDTPFRTVYWPLEKTEITPSEVALYLTENADATVETQNAEAFFKNAISVEAWMGDDEKADAKRFGDLVKTINAELDKPAVYLIGERERTAAIIGKVAGGFAGVVTLVVET